MNIYMAIIGGREFVDYEYMKEAFHSIIDSELFRLKNVLIVSGGSEGADTLAERISREELHKEPIVKDANWTKYGRSAGPRRNTEIVAASDCVVAFWNGKTDHSGTFDTIKKTVAAKKPVFIFPY